MGTINSSLLYHVNEATNLTTKILTSFFNDEISLKKEDYNNNSEYSSVMEYLISALCSANIYELINLIKPHYSHREITSSGIPQYSDFSVAMYEVPKLLSNIDNGVANNEELGKLLWPTERAQAANSKYGENHRNTAALIGLVGYKGGRIVLTDLGQLFLSLNPAQQATLIPKLWLRVPLFYNYFGSDNHEATLKSDISILSDTTQKRRLSNIRIIIDIIKKGYYFPEEPKIPQVEQEVINIPVKEPLQLIFYGAPGTGKSFTIDKMAKDEVTVRTTFHPDSDYASFVGAYKPTMQSMAMSYISEGIAKYAKAWNGHDAQEKKIVYKYVPQAFLKAYVAAWADLDNPHYLVIEEINRGNCAQIFGDLFQLLDRNNMGSSSYAIHADEDIAQFLATDANGFAELSEEQKDAIRSFVLVKDSGERLPIGQEILDGKKLLLPPNLRIWATMNTSDQSLFPIDSAFKRRWNWRYMPIDYTKKNHTFLVGDNRYSWGEFLRKMNPTISTLTESPDKQMGYFFAKPDLKSSDAAAENDTISEEIFLNKVLFYLWTDVLKDFDAGEPFLNEDTGRAYEFSEFFDTEKNYLQKFVDKLGLEVVEVEIPDNNGNPSERIVFNAVVNDSKVKTITGAFYFIVRSMASDMTYSEIESAVSQYIHRDVQVIKSVPKKGYERENKWNNSLITAKDGVSFVVTNQWKIDYLPDVKALAEAFDVSFEVIGTTYVKGGKGKEYSSMVVSFPDGTTISEPSICETYLKAIEAIGVERAAQAAADKKYQRRGHELISTEKYSDLEEAGYKYGKVGDYYIVLPTRTESLQGMLTHMSEMFDLGLTISLA